jgi:hypothetical protein
LPVIPSGVSAQKLRVMRRISAWPFHGAAVQA